MKRRVHTPKTFFDFKYFKYLRNSFAICVEKIKIYCSVSEQIMRNYVYDTRWYAFGGRENLEWQ
jgi:hypothetical protein